MISVEEAAAAKRVGEPTKKSSPLKVVSPIIRKYSGHRQGRIKKKLKFPRILHTTKSPIKPQLKAILPKTAAGDIIILEKELLPCALNLHKNKKKDEDVATKQTNGEQMTETEEKQVEKVTAKETNVNAKAGKSKLIAFTKKKTKHFKNIEATLGLLKPETAAIIDKREENFAENYLLKVQQKLKGKDEGVYNQFLDLISDFQAKGITVVELYKQVKDLFSAHSEIFEDFVAFLTPEQAVECGVFMDHHLLKMMTDFLSMINVHFSKSPHQVKKIHSVLDSLASRQNVSTDDVISTILPLLKGNSVLADHFLCLLPHGRPPDNFLIDFEEIEYPELNSDMSEDEDIFESIHIPEVEDPFGGDSCSCKCHNSEDEKCKTRVHHCMSCSTKFINGKIFIQCGKLLRPAKVVFDDHDLAYHRDRLAPKLYPKRGRKRTRHAIFKENLSPTKSCNLSSDEFKSDIEEDEKARSKLGNCKSPRISRKKSVSPKSCDKTIPRCIFNELKAEAVEAEDKVPAKSISELAEVPEEDKSDKKEAVVPNCEPLDDKDLLAGIEPLDLMEVEEPKINQGIELMEVDEPKMTEKELLLDPKSLDLPKMEMEQEIKLDTNPVAIEPESPSLIITKESSKSPPVISIPDSANPCLFSTSKPILSLLEKLDDPKEPTLMFIEAEAKLNIQKLEDAQEAMVDSQVESLQTSSICDNDIKLEADEENTDPWKIEEDRIILQTLQVEENCEETFIKISSKIPSRCVEDIKKRFTTLMSMLYEMKAKTNN